MTKKENNVEKEKTSTEMNEEEAASQKEQNENAADEVSEIELLKKEQKELKDRYHRALADYQNLQRRSAKEVLEAKAQGVAEFMKKLLPVLDTLEKLTEQIAKSNIDKKIQDGIELFTFQLMDLLESEGLKEIPTKDQKFDPNFHEAMCKRTDESKDDEVILTEFNKGYTFKDRVLRPSQVEINHR